MSWNSRSQTDSLESVVRRDGTPPRERALAIIRELTHQVDALHASGQLHRAVDAAHVHWNADGQPVLTPAGTLVRFGGAHATIGQLPPEIELRVRIFLPVEMDHAQRILADARVAIHPRRIDVYQLCGLLLFLLTGKSVDEYLCSPTSIQSVDPQVCELGQRLLGFDARHRIETCQELRDLLDEFDRPPTSSQADDAAAKPIVAVEPIVVVAPRDVVEPHTNVLDQTMPTERLGHFRLVERVGRGGMGDVYRAYDESLGRVVAVKVLPVELARHEEHVRRFRAEAAAAAGLNHPNIVPVYFIGQDGPYHFFAMQLVDGESLADRLQRQPPLSVESALRLVEDCLQGLDAAHCQGLIHRDIKPSNILIDRHSGRAMLADFGLVRRQDPTTQLTATGTVLGTVDYIAPEQARGHPVDSRADLYAVGVVLYRLLSGRLPFQADSATAMLFQHAYEEPPPLDQLVPQLPQSLTIIVARLMAKRPQDRYSDCQRVLADLAAFRTGQPLSVFDASALGPGGGDLPDESAGWWRAIGKRLGWVSSSRVGDVGGEGSPTQQSVDAAIAEYQQRHVRLRSLLSDAEVVQGDFATQLAACDSEAAAAQRRLAESVRDDERDEAARMAASVERDAEQLRARLAEHREHIDTMRLELARIAAKLVDLRSQRDLLLARWAVAQARLGGSSEDPRAARRPVWRMIPFVLGLAMALVTIVVVVRSATLRLRTSPTTATSSNGASGRTRPPSVDSQSQASAHDLQSVPTDAEASKESPLRPAPPAIVAKPTTGDTLPTTAGPASAKPIVPRQVPKVDPPNRWPDDAQLARLEAAPVTITELDPPSGRPGDLVTIRGRGFQETREVFFTLVGCERTAAFEVIHDGEMRVTVPESLVDGFQALITVVGQRGLAVTVPWIRYNAESTLLFDRTPESTKSYRQRVAVARPNSEWPYHPELNESLGDTLIAESGAVTAMPKQSVGTTYAQRRSQIVDGDQKVMRLFHEPGVVFGGNFERTQESYDSVHRVAVDQIALCPVRELFQIVREPVPEPLAAEKPPNVTDFQPREGAFGQIVELRGSGFAGTTHVWAASDGWHQLAHFRVDDDSRLRVEIPWLPTGSSHTESPLMFVVANPRGAAYTVPPEADADWQHFRLRRRGGVRVQRSDGRSPNLRLDHEADITVSEVLKAASVDGGLLAKKRVVIGSASSAKSAILAERGAAFPSDAAATSAVKLLDLQQIDASNVPRLFRYMPFMNHVPIEAAPVARLFQSLQRQSVAGDSHDSDIFADAVARLRTPDHDERLRRMHAEWCEKTGTAKDASLRWSEVTFRSEAAAELRRITLVYRDVRLQQFLVKKSPSGWRIDPAGVLDP